MLCQITWLSHATGVVFFVRKNNFGPEATLRKAYVLKTWWNMNKPLQVLTALKNITSLNQEAKNKSTSTDPLALQMSQDSDLGYLWKDVER